MPCCREYVIHHRRCQLSGICILPARVIAADERQAVRQRVRDAVGEPWTRFDHDAARLQKLQIRVETDSSKRDDHADVRQGAQFRVEMRKAVDDFLGRRLVIRRCAAYGRRDERVPQHESIVAPLRGRDVREAETMERGHQEITGAADAIAREHATRAVRAMRRRRQSDNQQARVTSPKPGTGFPQYASLRYARRFSRATRPQ